MSTRKDGGGSASGADTEDEEAASDAMPTSRAGRMKEVGLLGARLATTMAKAGAQSLGRGAEVRRGVWSEAHRAGAAMMVETLGRMRGVAAKFGQLLAQHPGSLPEEYIEAMLALTNQVPPMGYGMVKTQLLRELGRSPIELFAEFSREPLAAASFGQVHRALTHDGRVVAVKIQYPAVELTLQADLDNLQLLIGPLGRIGAIANIEDAFDEVKQRLTEEVDYRREAEHLELFRRIFKAHPEFVIPGVERALSTARVLTMDLVEGADIARFLASAPAAETRDRFGMNILRFTWHSEFRHGVLHVDPNPGNYLFLEDGRLGVLDFGCIKHFAPSFVEHLRILNVSSIDGDTRLREDALVASGIMSPHVSQADRRWFHDMLTAMARPFLTPEFDFGRRDHLDEMVQHHNAMMNMGRRGIALPRDFIFFGRQVLGLTYLLFRLGARGRFAEAYDEFIRTPAPAATMPD